METKQLIQIFIHFRYYVILHDSVGKESACKAGNTGDASSISGSGRSFGVGNGNPLQYSCLENSMDRGVWWATVHGVTKNWIWLSNNYVYLYMLFCTYSHEQLALLLNYIKVHSLKQMFLWILWCFMSRSSAVARGLEKVSIHSNPKERQCQRMLKLPHNCTHLTC